MAKALERVGVTPGEVVLSTPNDLAAGRDPVLARAAELAGAKDSTAAKALSVCVAPVLARVAHFFDSRLIPI